MERIAILLPRQTILEYAENVLEKDGIEVQILKVVENANAVMEAQEASAAGVRIIIARGLQATLIKENTNIPVVEMPITIREIGMMILKAKRMLKKDHPYIGIVAFKNMLVSTDQLEELFDFDLRFYELKDLEETRLKVSQAIKDGVDLVIGGVRANQTAFEIGFPSLFIETGEESIRNALGVAIHMIRLSEMEKQNEAQIETLLDTSFSGIIKINAYKEIVAVNRVIEQMMGKPASEVVGFPIDKVFEGIDTEGIEGILSGADELYSTSFSIRDQLLMVIGAPIQYDGHFSGAILTCHKIKGIEKADSDVSGAKPANGYIASCSFGNILRESRDMKRCLKLARSYAISRSPVLICGETGTEKEILAEAVHNNSPQKGGPFLNINCGALSPGKQREVLFGSSDENRKSRKGAWEAAAYGTILVQEVDKMSPDVQYLLYKAVHDRLFWFNGSMVKRALPVRLMVTTAEELAVLTKEGRFREDLYYLISPLKIELPPLRKTPEDIRRLVKLYLEKFNASFSRYVEISEAALKVMEGYHWEGNLLQLEAFCERLVLTAHRRLVEEGMVENLLQELYPLVKEQNGMARTLVLKNPEAVRIAELLDRYHGNRTMVAEELQISATTLWRKMKRYGIGSKYEI
ncbi:PrpR N-terminal domain-containing protein [Lachnospiraceae bacterium 54-53]